MEKEISNVDERELEVIELGKVSEETQGSPGPFLEEAIRPDLVPG